MNSLFIPLSMAPMFIHTLIWDLLAHATKHGWSLVALEQKRLHGLLDAPESAIWRLPEPHDLDLSCASLRWCLVVRRTTCHALSLTPAQRKWISGPNAS